MADTLTRKINNRNGLREQFNKTFKQVSVYLETSDSIMEAKLISFENNMQRKSGELQALNDEVQEEIKQDRVERDVEESVEFLEPLDELMVSLSLKLGELRLSKTANGALVWWALRKFLQTPLETLNASSLNWKSLLFLVSLWSGKDFGIVSIFP